MSLIIAEAQCELREVSLKDKPAAMLEASPKGTVPVLLFPDGTVIDESLDIMLWALSQTDASTWLNPAAGDLEGMMDLIGRNDTGFKPHLDRYKYPDRYSKEDADPLAHRAEACVFLNELETLLECNDFLFGPRPSLADIAIFPFVRQFAATDSDWFAGLDAPRLHTWLSGWKSSDLFSAAMHKHPVWQTDNPPDFLLS